MDIIKTRFEEHIALAQLVAQSEIMQQVADAVAIIKKALAGGHKVLFCGNGGSAADSQHLAAEFVGRFQKERKGIAGIALTVDTSILTAVANDYGYDRVFSRQVEALGQQGDVLVGISTSGNSKNVLAAIAEAKTRGIQCIGMTAQGGGKMKDECDICIAIPCPVTARAQEMHILIGHISANWWMVNKLSQLSCTKFLAEKIQQLKIAVIGDVMLDRYFYGDVKRISPEAPVPVNKVTRITSVLGGAAKRCCQPGAPGMQGLCGRRYRR